MESNCRVVNFKLSIDIGLVSRGFLLNLTLNNSYLIDKYNASDSNGVKFESCLTWLHLGSTLGLHIHVGEGEVGGGERQC